MTDVGRKTCTLIVTHYGPCHHDPAVQGNFPAPTCGQVVTR